MRFVLMLLVAFACFGAEFASADSLPIAAKVRIVLLCPADRELPVDYQAGIDRVANYTDRFVLNGLKLWKLEPKTESLFVRNGDHVEVIVVHADGNAAAYTKPDAHKVAIETAARQNRLNLKLDLWWVFVYQGEPPQRFSDFRGGSSPRFGGWSIANYDSRSPSLPLQCPLGGGMANEMALKGMIHELGHAFGLPHMGPRFAFRRGNTLMGAVNTRYQQISRRRDGKVYLSQAAAGMLIAHPVLQGRAMNDLGDLPSVSVDSIEINASRKTFRFSGEVDADRKPVFAVVGDHNESLPGEYWTKHYVGSVSADGKFSVAIDEPASTNGELKLWFVFADGTLTGNGDAKGERGAVKVKYGYAKTWRLR